MDSHPSAPRPASPYHDQRVVPLLRRGGLSILLLFALVLLLAAAAGARFLGPLLQGPLVEAHRVPALQLQLLRLGLLVPALAVDMVPPAALDALPQPLHHRAVLGNAAAVCGIVTGSGGRRAVGSAVNPDTGPAGPAEAAVQVIVDANTAAIRGGSGGCKIPHPRPRAHYFGRTFYPTLHTHSLLWGPDGILFREPGRGEKGAPSCIRETAIPSKCFSFPPANPSREAPKH